ncbi:MAG: putative glycoside hydrolase [Nitrospirae bacterium]|nr:putative glycoside hydrolase [Nitrospirota bacterium]
MFRNFIIILSAIVFFPLQAHSGYTAGKVVDLFTGQPVKDAIITLNSEVSLTNESGDFFVKAEGSSLSVRAHGYLKEELPLNIPLITTPLIVKLTPFKPKGLYLTVYGIGDRNLRNAALGLIEETELNTLVIDVKGDRGLVPYKSSVPLASEIGAQKITTVRDIRGLMKSLKEKGIYTIARIVVFKDNLLALARPDLAVKTRRGDIWLDREDLAWVDPCAEEVWDYNINIAIEAAQLGFDEIQFDYVRFPDAAGLEFSVPNTEAHRTMSISMFLREAKKRLTPYNVFLSADIFGYVCWNLNDTDIGQRIEDISKIVDYVSPMLYPSGFQYGIPGYLNPVAHPYEIVYLSLKRALERTSLPPKRFRPWLQAFRDYAFDRRHFTGYEIRAQIDAAEKAGSDGWMLWNPHNVYSPDGLKKKKERINF